MELTFCSGTKLVLDFATSPVSITSSEKMPPPKSDYEPVAFLAVLESERQAKIKMCAAAATDDITAGNAIDECAIPLFSGPPCFELPECPKSSFTPLVEEYKDLFRTQPRQHSTT